MPVKAEIEILPPFPANAKQPGVTSSLLYNGSRFQGHQKSKGNCYDVEVVLQVQTSFIDNIVLQRLLIALRRPNLNLLKYSSIKLFDFFEDCLCRLTPANPFFTAR